MKRAVIQELMRFHRREQTKKLRAIFAFPRFQKVDNFSLLTDRSGSQQQALDRGGNQMTEARTCEVSRVLGHFPDWLETYGETSWDYQASLPDRWAGEPSHFITGTSSWARLLLRR